MSTTTPQLPSSSALSEATPDSLSELFSRDPEHFTDQDLDKIIFALREQRERHVQAEALGIKAPKPTKIPLPTPVTSTAKLRI